MNKYKFTDILSNEIEIEELDDIKKYRFDGIQIPMIQRDYAQGRQEESEIRRRFLNAIFDALIKNESLELDFIYGSIKELDTKKYFIPLDGQQRLTTLFLLYWYIGNREVVEEELDYLRNNLIRFSYATRISARQFCEKLSRISIEFKSQPSSELKNAAWFYSSYKKDPTVMSMLQMLDSIHEKYQHVNRKLFGSLSNLSFYILPLDGFNLTDELYVKMNARGKQLTDYENFKADLINWIQDIKNPFKEEFHKETKIGGRGMPYYLAFGVKLDNDWTNLFWKYTKEHDKSDDKIVDPYFVRFWNRYLLNVHITQSDVPQDKIEKTELFQKFYGFQGNDSSFKYENFDSYKVFFEKEGTIYAIERTLDRLVSHYDEIQKIIKPAWKKHNDWNLFNKDISQSQRILFYAVTQYLEENDFDSVRFKNWIRIVWNIIIDPDIRSIPAMVNVMRLVKQLSVGSSDIYRFLVSDAATKIINQSNFKGQLEEERFKANLILSDLAWENELINGEQHPLFLGNIEFLLLSNPTIEVYKSRLDIAEKLFNSKGSNNQLFPKHKLIRALISKFDNWNDLFKLDLGDNYDNWQLLLRRNSKVKEILCVLCDCDNVIELNTEIDNCVFSESLISGYADTPYIAARINFIHKQLYSEEKLHCWFQQKGATKLRKRNDRIFIDRPGAWYDRVMIDTFRNELITKLIEKYGFTTSHRCNDSNYYWNTWIHLSKYLKNFTLTLFFDEVENFIIGIKDDEKSIVQENIEIEADEIDSNWIFRKKYNYNKILTSEDVDPLLQRIDKEIFDLNEPSSLFARIRACTSE